MAKREAVRKMIVAGQTLVFAGIIFGILTFGSRKTEFAIGVVALGELLWVAGWVLRGFRHPDR
jgi:hypothetical protein